MRGKLVVSLLGFVGFRLLQGSLSNIWAHLVRMAVLGLPSHLECFKRIERKACRFALPVCALSAGSGESVPHMGSFSPNDRLGISGPFRMF